MPTIATGYSCPSCKRESGATNEILADNSRLTCSKVPAHVWNDVDEFMSTGPRIEFRHEMEKPAPQANHTSLNLSIPVSTLNVLQAKYGDKLNSTLAGLCQVLVEGEPMIISDTDVQRLSGGECLGEKPKNGSHLVGLVFSLRLQVGEAKMAAEAATKDMAAFQGMAPGRVVIDLGDQYAFAQQRAQAEEPPIPVSLWVQRGVRTAVENNWW
jgi:hypothetical protein